jgi:hypothetical protein
MFEIFQYQIHEEVEMELKQQINASELTAIVINKNQFDKIQWLKRGEELRYNNEIFDVVKSIQNDTTIIYYCIDDKQEALLFDKLQEHITTYVTTNKPIKNKTSKKWANNFNEFYFINKRPFQFNFASANQPFFPYLIIYASAIIEMNSPPPKFA